MDNMTTNEITMEEAKQALMNYNSVKERFVHELNIEFNITILSVNDDNTVDWIDCFKNEQHSEITLFLHKYVYLGYSRFMYGNGIYIDIKKIEEYLK